jgi:hypothetical protein
MYEFKTINITKSLSMEQLAEAVRPLEEDGWKVTRTFSIAGMSGKEIWFASFMRTNPVNCSPAGQA